MLRTVCIMLMFFLLGAAAGCGDGSEPRRRLHLLDVGFPIELKGAVLSERAVKVGGNQYRAAFMPSGSSVAIQGVDWPREGALEIHLAPDRDSETEGRANLFVALRGTGGVKIELGVIPLDAAGWKEFRPERIEWKDIQRGVYDLVYRIEFDKNARGAWLLDGGVLNFAGPFTEIKRLDGAGPNLVLVLIDTLRADHLGCYGYGRDTSPVMDRLAEEGLRFTDLWAQASWTKPSTATILTSLPSYEHGAVKRFDPLADRVWTLSEELKAAGFRTAAFIANGWVGNAHFNFNQGFDHFIKVDGVDPEVKGRADDVLERAVEWVAREGERPFFLFLHLIDPHSPYTPPEDVKAAFDRGYQGDIRPYPAKRDNGFRSRPLTTEDRNHLVDLYDAEIRFTDQALGAFMEGIEALGIKESTVFMITSDHGEEFLDHGGLEHGETLFEEQLKVPMLIVGPGVPRGETFDGLVRHMDIAPVALGLLGLRSPPAFLGRDLLAEEANPLGWALADLDYDKHRALAVRVKHLKLIRKLKPEEGLELYDLAKDPGETSNLAPERPEQAKMLAELTAKYEAQVSRPGLYIACRGAEGVEKFMVQIGGEHPISEYHVRLSESMDGFQPVDKIKGVRFLLRADGPDDIDIIYIVSELKGRYGLLIEAEGKQMDPALFTLGRGQVMEGSWPLVVDDAFMSMVIPASPPVDLNALVKPGGAAVFRILPTEDFGGIPQADIEELKKLGYF